jgi:Ca-activated chloride channel family protein
MIAFAGNTYLVSPLTLDHDWLERNLARVELGTLEDGTAIGSALTAAVNRLRTSDARSKIVVLLTDGVNNTGKIQPLLAAESAAALGIKVYTIGVGAEGTAPIPMKGEDGRTRLVMAQTDLDENTLKQIAAKTGGEFFRATDTASLESIYARIDSLEKTTREVHHYEHREEKVAWALLPALALIAAELVFASTWLRRLP